ncbi:MAG TPA: UDP-N-acetylglucosamine 2-epimerase (non-hydrolyzing) [Anaeromyxobacter sp.]|nr:UDP-N-acetylglucosamine 2-epimerase (non-hydrolyzing) [Anaeromyxobacter sp.]
MTSTRPRKLLVAFGTRPEAIKLAPVIRELAGRPGAEVRVCLTGQHREMVDGILSFFGLPQHDDDLAIMRPNQSLNEIAARAFEGIDRVLARFQPDWTLVQGDTTTAFVSALASFHRRVKVAHVEAGLRSHDRFRPYPEEVNRVMTAVVADLHFAPTPRARADLLAERIPAERIQVVGNTVVDALRLALPRVQAEGFAATVRAELPGLDPGRPLVLVTGHRRESFGAPFRELCLAIRDLAERNPVQVVYPVHLNPNVRAPVQELLSGTPNVRLVEPVSYPLLVWLAQRSRFILTDSGGIQEEAAALGRPVLVMREVTERRESVEAGVSRLVGTERAAILEWGERLLRDDQAYRAMARPVDVYGDGHASERIADALLGAPGAEPGGEGPGRA